MESIFPKVLYKLTTDENELKILQEALEQSRLLTELQQVKNQQKLKQGRKISQAEADQRNIVEEAEEATLKNEAIETEGFCKRRGGSKARRSCFGKRKTTGFIEIPDEATRNDTEAESTSASLDEEEKSALLCH